MSLFDELNNSFDSEVTVVLESSSVREDASILGDDELQNSSETQDKELVEGSVHPSSKISTNGSMYLHPTSFGRTNDRSYTLSDYSGSEWGDPADDSDPDGRFDALDEAIEHFVDCISSDFDSAYESQDDDNLTHNGSTSSILHGPSSVLRLLQGMQNLPSQMMLENSLTRYADLHEQAISATSRHAVLLRDMMQTASKAGQDYSSGTVDNHDLALLIDDLAAALPDIDFQLTDEVAVLERETHNLVVDLVCLNDSLHEMKQTVVNAQRLLRSTQNMVVVWQKEIEDVTTANAWLAARHCEEKLASRSTAHELLSIRVGFDEVCSAMREDVAKGLEERRLLI